MKNLYFKGLNKCLTDGCYIKVFSSSLRCPVVRVEKKKINSNEPELVSYAEGGNVLALLNSASSKIVDELDNVTGCIICERTLIDNVVEIGYTLHFLKLSNGLVLSAICSGGYGNYIPVKSVITDDVASGFKMLNATLKVFDNSQKFIDFASEQINPVYEYQKTFTKK